MTADLLVDTDVLVDHLRGARRFEPGSRAAAYSVITRCELFAGRSADEERLALLLAPFLELAVDREIAETAGRLRRDGGIRTPDALIAATALVRGLALLTRNRRDFEAITGLHLAD
ncbi:MAG: type II toxin-antitoxin system VapC family toxin [Candidatus Limnocylindrales bacterium]